MMRSIISRILVLIGLAAIAGLATAQQDAPQDLVEQDWRALNTPHFTIISQTSQRKTRRFANNLESWRRAAAYLLAAADGSDAPAPFPVSPVPNLVYLFDNREDYQAMVNVSSPGYFFSTPRANYLAVLAGDAESFASAGHHYAHFLIKNFADLSLPRWFEEGMAAYLARIQIDGDDAQFNRFSSSDHQTMMALSESFEMERLLFRDDALASPRVVQIANLKAEYFLYFLLHGYQEAKAMEQQTGGNEANENDGTSDRRGQLIQYLALLRQDRNPRFAYDRAFDATVNELEQEFHNYLSTSARPAVTLPVGRLPDSSDYQTEVVEQNQLAVMLAELALNLGQFTLAESLYRHAADNGSNSPRAQAGIGDALRMQELDGMDQTIARQFTEALSLAPNDLYSLLDFGVYWEEELKNCEKTYPDRQRQLLMTEMEQYFKQAVTLEPDNAEANLAMGQFYLFPDQQWQQGVEYQRKAFALLPADTFVMEQAVNYAIAQGAYQDAERLIAKLATPIHLWGEPGWVQSLRVRLMRHQRGEEYVPCEK